MPRFRRVAKSNRAMPVLKYQRPLSAGVMFAVQVFEALACNMCVYLRCRQIAVAQQHLHDAQVRASIQQMRGEGMSQAMWRHFVTNSGFLGVSFDNVPKRLASHSIAKSFWLIRFIGISVS